MQKSRNRYAIFGRGHNSSGEIPQTIHQKVKNVGAGDKTGHLTPSRIVSEPVGDNFPLKKRTPSVRGKGIVFLPLFVAVPLKISFSGEVYLSVPRRRRTWIIFMHIANTGSVTNFELSSGGLPGFWPSPGHHAQNCTLSLS